MDSIFLIAVIAASFLILLVPGRIRYFYALLVSLFIVVFTSIPAIAVFCSPLLSPVSFSIGLPHYSLAFTIDALSAFFILVTNLVSLAGMLYSRGYLQPYLAQKSRFELSLHYFCFVWLHLSMLAVLMLRDGLPFLVAWELMAVSSFMLVLFEGEKRITLKTAVTYLIQMHIGFFLLVTAFLVCGTSTGIMSFDALKIYFTNHRNFGLFLLFFAGFGIKAGFMPMHTWLPGAHPAAPSHVSGVMSGVMIKMGIYGIVRILMYIQSDVYAIGVFILVISAISGVMGVMMAIVQHDLKKLLAYHSIENIGIIGMGIGLGTMGLGIHNPMLVVLGFGGGLLHVLNHSLFKSLLFFSAGSVYKRFHTRNIEDLGGIIHQMPKTATFFLIGSVAICGLPPLNGFISEILIYAGLFRGLSAGGFNQSVALLLAIIALALIGGLAIFCFTKAFSVVFLGSPRKMHPGVKEVDGGMLFPQAILALLIIAIGLFPVMFVNLILHMLSTMFSMSYPDLSPITGMLTKIGLLSFILIAVVLVLFYVRYLVQKKRIIQQGPTWGCGYTAVDARQQYTGSSYAGVINELADPLLHSHTDYRPIAEEEFFPSPRKFETHPVDVFGKGLSIITDFLMLILKKLARLQTGYIQHYILYAFVYILIIFVLLYLKLL